MKSSGLKERALRYDDARNRPTETMKSNFLRALKGTREALKDDMSFS
jgi:hypothetical protein